MSIAAERFDDAIGSALISDYFGPVLEPQFTLWDALDANVLVPQEYDFITSRFSGDAQDHENAH